MAKKLDLRGKNSSRNKAGKETIQNSAAFQAVVEQTKAAITSKQPKPSQAKYDMEPAVNAKDVDSVIDKIAGENTARTEYKSIPTSSLVPAPPEWNYFSSLSEEKKSLMAESIYYNGLLQPIVVRSLNENNTEYEILAGHHRTEAYAVLFEVTGDKKYLRIDARVFPYKALTDEQAREIVEDTNFVQRGNLSARDKALCIYNKAKALRAREVKGDIMDMVAGHFGITRTTVFHWKKLVDLIPEFSDYFAEGHINILAASKLAGFPPAIQEELYKHKELVTNESMATIKAKDDPAEVLEKLKKFATKQKGNYYGNIVKSDTNNSKLTITVDKLPPASMQPVLLYIPEKKLDVFRKKYGEYIISQKQ